jgi:hypothetical protein
MADEFKLQWSVSLAPVAQYAKGHMFNFRAETTEELEELFDAVLNSETIDKALAVADLLTAGAVVKGNNAPVESTAAPATSGPSATVTQLRTCEHGKRTQRSGTKNGRSWTGYFCPLAKGDPNQCKPEFED